MKLINDFFFIEKTRRGDGAIECMVRLNPEHYIYKAHFPGTPVTPGVCIIQMATEILEDEYGKSLSLSEVAKARFKQVIVPIAKPVFSFKIVDKNERNLNVRVDIESSDIIFAQLSLRFIFKNV